MWEFITTLFANLQNEPLGKVWPWYLGYLRYVILVVDKPMVAPFVPHSNTVLGIWLGFLWYCACCISCSIFGGAKVRAVVVELGLVVQSPSLGRLAGCSNELLHERKSSSSSSSVKFNWVELEEVGGLTGRGVATSSVRNCMMESEIKPWRDSISRLNLLTIFLLFFVYRRYGC